MKQFNVGIISFYYREGDKEVHTQRIEGTWFRIKRWLPSTGRYKLETYFPVFLWGLECEKCGVSTFWELLEIISKSNCEKLLSLKLKNADNEEKIPCVYCVVSLIRNVD